MSWMPEERALLLRLAESGVLRREQLAGAGARAPLRPTPAEWRSALDHVFALGGALLLAAAVVFFIAYNWEAMHRFARLGLAIGVLVAFCGGALLVRPAGVGWRAALFGACVASGEVLGWWESEFRVVAVAFSLVAGVSAAVYHRVRRDLAILALAVYGGIAVLTAGLVKLLRVESFLGMNLVGLFIIAASAGAGMWLAGLHRQAAVGGAGR
ncbi:hypothetical protein CKCBHOJB_02476 [Thauera sp. GDN1]|uniref:DUF2157 domain-containing protein n=1 Tax=Thauera sp. GDN1 TaxID=2944810 RepID=UPI0024790BEA|nr:DUF2157 domain-containing protein [Thauera sp. GDN1]WEN42876.1 hypothetical protein CKCBHOJB_02476 [Thauera sp. GDN1]